MNEPAPKRDPLFGTSPDLKEIVELPLDQISLDPDQPRKTINEESLRELAASIREYGLLQPITVRREPGGDGYIVVAGERRFRAHQLLGRERIEAIIRRGEGNFYEIALVENLQREDLTPFEEAAGYQRLMAEFGYTQEQVAERVGRAQNTISATLSLNALPEAIRAEYPTSDGLSKSVLIELAQIGEPEEQLRLWAEAKAGRLKTVRAFRERKQPPKVRERAQPSEIGKMLSLGRSFLRRMEQVPDEYLAANQADYAALVALEEQLRARLDATRRSIGDPVEAAPLAESATDVSAPDAAA